MTTEFIAGPSAIITWTYGTTPGTITLQGDYRTCSIKSSGEIKDGTAGADTNKVNYFGMRDISVDIELVTQTGGTAMNAALDANVIGTLVIQPEGTATNKPKFTIPAFSQGASYSFPYNDVATISVTFSANGAYTIGAN